MLQRFRITGAIVPLDPVQLLGMAIEIDHGPVPLSLALSGQLPPDGVLHARFRGVLGGRPSDPGPENSGGGESRRLGGAMSSLSRTWKTSSHRSARESTCLLFASGLWT